MSTPIFDDPALFEEIKMACPRKKVVSLCGKLAKKCSYKSGKDCEALCHLAYRLFVYGQPELAMACIRPTHELAFSPDFSVRSFLHAMWGLEMRILRDMGQEEQAAQIAGVIDGHLLTPTPLKDTPEKAAAHEEKRRARFTCESVCNEEKIRPHVERGNQTGANDWRFTSLFSMIGRTETGLYPELNRSREQIEGKIREYLAELEQVP